MIPFFKTSLNFLLGLFFCLSLSGCNSKKELGSSPVFESGTFKVQLSDFSKMLISELANYNALLIKDPAILSAAKTRVLNRLTIEALLENWSQTVDIDMSPKATLELVDKLLSAYPNDIYLKQIFSYSENTPTEWRLSVRSRTLFSKLIASLDKDIEKPTLDEARAYYKENKSLYKRPRQVKLRQIVLSSLNNARRVESRLRRGANFKKLAQQFSVAPEAKNGGDTGWINVKTLDIYKRAFNMRIGQQSPVLKSPFGFHIYRLRNKRIEKTLPLGSVRSKVDNDIKTLKLYSLFKDWARSNLKKFPIRTKASVIDQLRISTEDNS